MEKTENWKVISFPLEFKNKVTCFGLVVRATTRPLQIPQQRVRFNQSPYQPLPLECQLQCSTISPAFRSPKSNLRFVTRPKSASKLQLQRQTHIDPLGCYQVPFQPDASWRLLSLSYEHQQTQHFSFPTVF